MKRIKGNTKLIVGLVLGIFISAVTSYAVAETLIKSADVSYVDNSKLGATNVQAAIDGTCTKFSNDLATLLDKMYPIGSIYISTTLSTPAQVGSAIGGTWEAYGKGKTLVGVDTSQTEFDKIGETGGSNTVTLTTDNLPSHSHSFTPLGSVTSTFTGTAVNTGKQSADHTHSIASTTASHSLKAESNGAHSHTYDYEFHTAGAWTYKLDTYDWPLSFATKSATTSTAGAHEHNIVGTITIPALTTGTNSADHTHSVTAKGTVSSTFTGTAGTTGVTGKATAVNVQNPYITVYMYKRTK